MSEILVAELVAELFGPHKNLKHYSRSTFNAGCRGPLCRKAERDKTARRRWERNPKRKPPRRRPEMIELDACLDEVIKALGLLSEEQAATLARSEFRAAA